MGSSRNLRSTTFFIIFSLLSLCMIPAAVFGYTETFYVSENGDGSSPTSGNPATAWNADAVSNPANWSTAVATVDGKIGPGDRVYFMSDGGPITGSGSAVIIVQGSGVPGYPITLQGDGNAVIDGQNARRGLTGDTKDYITVDNLKITRGYQFNLSTWMCNYWVIQNSEIWAAYQTASNNGTDIGASGSHFIIQYNNLHDSGGQHGIYFFAGDSNTPSDDNTIQYNFIHNNPEDGIHINGNTLLPTGNVIRYNWIQDNGYAQIEDNKGDGTQIYGNIILLTLTTQYIQGIVVTNDTSQPGTVANTKIYNNTFMGAFQAMIFVGVNTDPASVSMIENNIFYKTSGGQKFIWKGQNGTIAASDYNQFYDADSSASDRFYWYGATPDVSPNTLSAWQSATGFDAHSDTRDPLFLSPGTDFRLATNSPCIDTGTNVGLSVDRIGTAIPQGQAPDKGAFECIGGVVQPLAPTGLIRIAP